MSYGIDIFYLNLGVKFNKIKKKSTWINKDLLNNLAVAEYKILKF